MSLTTFSPYIYQFLSEQTKNTVLLNNLSDISKNKINLNSSDNSNSNELSDSEKQEVSDLQTSDRKIRAHELAHISVGGRFAGGVSYEFQTGPDNKQYAIGGEVPISIVTGKTPDETIGNMTQVIAAALAPADPSSADKSVASTANSYMQKAISEKYKSNNKPLKNSVNNFISLYA